MKRESFVFYRSFAEAVKNMDKETKADFLDALCAYALDGEETDCEGVVAAFMSLVKPQIDANNQRYENGKRGGRPKNQEKTEEEPNENQTKTKQKPKQNQTETKTEPNVNVNVNDNVNDNENENDKEKESLRDSKKKAPAPKKSQYGFFKNVLLTDEEYHKLRENYVDFADRIERLSGYIESTGKRYKSHYATILNWARRDEEEGKPRGKPKEVSTIKQDYSLEAWKKRQRPEDEGIYEVF